MQWKRRLYAFLLRRILGPYLTSSSRAQLVHESVDIEVTEGKYLLRDVEFDVDYLHSLLSDFMNKGDWTFRLKHISVQKLEIQLALVENDGSVTDTVHTTTTLEEDPSNPDDSSYYSSFGKTVGTAAAAMRKMYKLGSRTDGIAQSSNNISLVAHIILNGVDIDVTTIHSSAHTNKDDEQAPMTSEGKDSGIQDPGMKSRATSFITSYMEAALNSLQVNVELSNVQLRLSSPTSHEPDPNAIAPQKITMFLHSISYKETPSKIITDKDTHSQHNISSDSSKKTMGMNKMIQISPFQLDLGSIQDEPDTVRKLLVYEGNICVQLASYSSENESQKTTTGHHVVLEHVLDISADQQLDLYLNSNTLDQLSGFFSTASERKELQSMEEGELPISTRNDRIEQDEDENDAGILALVLKQREEALHRANTKEVRGGILVPTLSMEQGGNINVTYDAFFDANDYSYSQHRSFRASHSSNVASSKDLHTSIRVSIHLAGVCIQSDFASETIDRNQSTRQEYDGAIVTAIRGLSLESSFFSESFISRLDITEIDVSEALNGRFYSLLHFERQRSDNDDENDILGSTSHPISIQIMRETSDKIPSMKIIASLDPLSICLRPSALAKFQRIKRVFNTSKSDDPLEEKSTFTSCVMTCARIDIHVPLVSTDSINLQAEIIQQFLHRHALCSHSNPSLDDHECSLQWSIDNIHFAFDSCLNPPTREEITPSIHAKLTSLRSIVGLSVPFHLSNGQIARIVLDLIIFDSDVLLDSKTVVMFEYSVIKQLSNASNASRRKWTKKYFPLITPLATVKATQNQDLKSIGRGARGSDPQAMMYSDACECDRNAFLYIPNIIVDISRSDLSFLGSLFSSPHYFCAVDYDDAKSDDIGTSIKPISADAIAYGFRCDLITISTHLDICSTAHDGSKTETNYSYIIALDRCWFHSLSHSFPRKLNARFILHDFSLFEAPSEPINRDSRSEIDTAFLACDCDNFCARRCKRARERRTKVKGSPLIFRSKICQPLSPRTPSIVLDMLQRFDENGSSVDEQSYYFSLYDSTLRCVSLNFDWARRLSTLINLRGHDDETPDIKLVEKPEENGRCQILKCFVTISDCGVDYISPGNFRTGSSIKIRIGEVRVTSNVLTPPVPTQNIHISISDIGLYISNERTSHKLENCGIVCANLFSDGGSGHEPWLRILPKSFEEAMGKMNFIAIVNVDSLDAIVTLVSAYQERKECTPSSTISLAVGRISLYACRDSLRCLSDTIGELLLVLTSPQSPQLKQTAEASDMEPKLNKRSVSIKNAMDDILFSENVEKRNTVDLIGFKNKQEACELDDTNASPAQYPLEYSTDLIHIIQSDRSWTTIDYLCDDMPQGTEQCSRWYNSQDLRVNTLIPEDATVVIDVASDHRENFKLFPQHISQKLSSNSILGAEAFVADAAERESLAIKLKLIITDTTLVCRFFEGYDWPQRPKIVHKATAAVDVKSKLLDELLNHNENVSSALHFDDSKRINDEKYNTPFEFTAWTRRQIDKFFQLQVTGLKTRVDLFQESAEHRLSSFINVSLTDLVLAERLSGQRPLKVFGEWASDKEHPRDTNDGLLMITMITMNPREKISSDKHLMSDEAQAVLEMLPMRCFLHQSTLKFMKEFFSYSDSTLDESPQLNIEPPPPTFFQLFKVKPVKLKIDYIPDRIDTAALKNGSLIELLNLLPIEDMILRLNPLEIHNSSGWSSIVTEIINRWLENITTNQMHKFITRTSPLQPISSVGEGVKELIMLPLEEYRQGGDVSSGLRKGASDLVGIVAYETAKVTGRLTKLAATTLDRTTKENSKETLWSEGNGVNNSGLTAQALEKLTRGIERANTKVIMIPYREYQRCGPKGAMKSVIKGLPVAICAPLSGAAEALSLGLQGLCDHIRPDQKNETEAYTD